MDIENAKGEVNELFNNISPLVTEIVSKHSVKLDNIIKKVSDTKSLTNEELREVIIQLSVESYNFGMDKDSSILKQECATTLMKEGMAIAYNNADGTQQVKSNKSITETVDKQVVNLLYNAVANMMKTKLDEAHRMTNALNSILISRSAEAKLAAFKGDPNDLGGKSILMEG